MLSVTSKGKHITLCKEQVQGLLKIRSPETAGFIEVDLREI
jgi:hypothetical protein